MNQNNQLSTDTILKKLVKISEQIFDYSVRGEIPPDFEIENQQRLLRILDSKNPLELKERSDLVALFLDLNNKAWINFTHLKKEIEQEICANSKNLVKLKKYNLSDLR